MKKLLLAVALTAIGFAANAAAVSWTVTGVNQKGTSTTASGYLAYLFISDATSISGVTGYSRSDITAALEAGTFASDYSSKAISTGVTSDGKILNNATTGTFSSGDVLKTFAVILDASTLDAAEFYVVNATDVSTTIGNLATMPVVYANFSATNSDWQAIPEPTSGMLLLVGGALLALKRKRA